MPEKPMGAQQAAEPSGSEQPLSQSEKDLVTEAYARLQIFGDGCREMHSRAREARRIALLDDPQQDLPGTPPEQRTLQLQTLKSTLNNCVADQMDNMPEAVMMPETPEMQDTAEDLTDIVRFILDQNHFENLHRRRVEDCFITGTSVTQIAWDEDMDSGRGNVALVRWPVEAFLWDPVAEDIQDARALIKVSWHPLSWYAARYPDKAKYVGPEEYAHDGVGVPDAWADKQFGDEDRAMLMEYWYRRYNAKTRRYTVNVAYIAGNALLEHATDVYDHGMYPFVLDVFTPIEGLPVGNGMVHEFAPMMRYINRYYHYLDESMRMSSKVRLLVRRTAKIDNDALTDWQKNIIEGEQIDDDAVRWFQSSPLTGAASGVAVQFQVDMKQDSGQNQFTRGETAGGVTAASAIAALQEAGGKITRLRTNVLNDGFRRIAYQAMWLISQFYTDAQTRLITGKDGNPRVVNMNAAHLFGERRKGALPPPPYTVQVQVQRRNPMRVQAQNELYLQAFSMAAQGGQNFPLTALFELLQVDGKDRILPVLRQVEQDQKVMQEAAAQLEQMGQENEALKEMVGNLQQALETQDVSSRSGMYPDEETTDEPLPDVAAI